MRSTLQVPELAFVRVLTGGGPYVAGDIVSVAFLSPLVGRLAAHRCAAVPGRAPRNGATPLVPESISVLVVRAAADLQEGDVLTLSFVDPGVARIHPSGAHRIAAGHVAKLSPQGAAAFAFSSGSVPDAASTLSKATVINEVQRRPAEVSDEQTAGEDAGATNDFQAFELDARARIGQSTAVYPAADVLRTPGASGAPGLDKELVSRAGAGAKLVAHDEVNAMLVPDTQRVGPADAGNTAEDGRAMGGGSNAAFDRAVQRRHDDVERTTNDTAVRVGTVPATGEAAGVDAARVPVTSGASGMTPATAAAARDASARNDPARHDAAPDDTAPDHVTRDTGARDTVTRDTGARGTVTRDTGARDTGARDTVARDTVASDTAARDTVASDTAARDTVARDTAARDTAARDTVASDTVARDTVARGTVARDTVARDTVARDTVASDTAARGTAARDAVTRGTVTREDTTPGDPMRNDTSNNDESRNDVSRNDAPHDDASHADATRGGDAPQFQYHSDTPNSTLRSASTSSTHDSNIADVARRKDDIDSVRSGERVTGERSDATTHAGRLGDTLVGERLNSAHATVRVVDPNDAASNAEAQRTAQRMTAQAAKNDAASAFSSIQFGAPSETVATRGETAVTRSGVRVRLEWSTERVRRFVRVVDKLFTVDRLGWYRHALAMRLLIPDSVTTGDELCDIEAMRHLHVLRAASVEALGRPLLAALMPNFSVTQEWLEALDSPGAARALGGLRDAIAPHVDDTRWPSLDELDPLWTVGTIDARDLLAPQASVEALLPVLIPTFSPSVSLSEHLTGYRHALGKIFGQTADCAAAVRVNVMSQPNHSLDDRLWRLVGVVGATFGALAGT